MTSSLEQRRRALEDTFFRKRDEELLDELRRRRGEEEEAQALAHACGLETHATELLPLVQQGLGTETLAALYLAPLVVVAWADAHLGAGERLELLEHAGALGVVPGSPAHRVLRSWLQGPPDPGLLDAWLAFARALAAELDPAQRAEVARDVLERARRVASAEGGPLGLGRRVSEDEMRVLDALSRAFEAV